MSFPFPRPFPGPSMVSFNVLSLFAAGEQGVWYDPSDFSTMFQDSAGTTPVTAVEQPVGLLLDKSKGLAVGAELVTNGTFNADLTGWTVGTDPLQVIPTWSAGAVSLTRGTGGNAGFSQNIGMTTGKWYALSFNLVSGNVTIGGFTGASGLTTTGQQTRYHQASSSTIQIWPTNLSSTVVIDNISVKEIAGNHARQSTTTSRPVIKQDANGMYYLLFDGTDDSLATGTIDPGSVDKAQVFAGVRKLSESGAGAQVIAEFNTGATNNRFTIGGYITGTPATRYFAASGGTSIATAETTDVAYAAPVTNVQTALGDISGDSVALRLNGIQIAQSTADQGTGNYGSYSLYIGRRGGSTFPYNGNLYSMILRFSAANLSDAQIASTETYVNSKTGAY